MSREVLCLRPLADFERAGALPPGSLEVVYRSPDDADVPELMKRASALMIPAVGPKLSQGLFENTKLRLVQVTGAGLDRLDKGLLERLGIPLANVPGGIVNGTTAPVTLTSNANGPTISNGIVQIVCTTAGAVINQINYTYNNGSGTKTKQMLLNGKDGGELYWEYGGYGSGGSADQPGEGISRECVCRYDLCAAERSG